MPNSAWSQTPTVKNISEHSQDDAEVRWRVSKKGVFIDGENKPQRTPGAPVTCQLIATRFADVITSLAIEHDIPPEFVIMVIATETAAYKQSGFTGPQTFRWEERPWVKDDPAHEPYRGDYSAGPMQLLGTTARWMMRLYDIEFRDAGAAAPLDPLDVFPPFRHEPASPPNYIEGYNPRVNITLGVQYMAHQWHKTVGDPVLVAAAYNAGQIRGSSTNRWGLVQYGNHIDRAVKWFGDACAVVKELRDDAVDSRVIATDIDPADAAIPETLAHTRFVRKFFWEDEVATVEGTVTLIDEGEVTAFHVVSDTDVEFTRANDINDIARVSGEASISRAPLRPGDRVTIIGFPAGTDGEPEVRTGTCYLERSAGVMIVRLDNGQLPVVGGMSGGAVVDDAGVVRAVATHRNSRAHLNNDNILDRSIDVAMLSVFS